MATQTTLETRLSIIEARLNLNRPTESSNSITVRDNRTGKEYTIPIQHNAVAANAFKDISAPNGSANGLRIYDPGYQNTAVSESTITFVDGVNGTIQYRGIPIEDLVGKVTWEDTAYLLIWGSLPTPEERTGFHQNLKRVSMPAQSIFDVIRAFPPSSPPLSMLTAGLSALQASQPETIPAYAAKNIYLGNLAYVDKAIVSMLTNIAVISAIVYCHHLGRPFSNPQPQLSYIENFLYMTGHVDAGTGLPNPKHVSCLERLWTLVADHEMTCSTAALLHTASSLSDAVACQISAIEASSGILHGGAIEIAYKNIISVGDVSNVGQKITDVKAGKERLYGYGHRLYKTVDPRSIFIRQILGELSEETAIDPVLSVAMELDRIASTDDYFIKRKLKANADFFASFVYKAMGFPVDFILPLSIISRTQGLMAHWREAMSGRPNIWRPQQIYLGKRAPQRESQA